MSETDTTRPDTCFVCGAVQSIHGPGSSYSRDHEFASSKAFYARTEKAGDAPRKWDQRFLALAEHVSAWSKDPSTRVGAVIVDSHRRIVSLGYNGFPRGVDDAPARYADRAVKYPLVVHAERNAIIFARQDLHGATLYTWPFMPCSPCAGMVVQAGIAEVVAPPSSNPRWLADFDLARTIFREAGVTLRLVGGEVGEKVAA